MHFKRGRTFFISDRPEAVTNCTQRNHTSDAVFVGCQAGYDGGLKQIFTIEIYDDADECVGNVTVVKPFFAVPRLPAASIYEARIYASNRKGRSPEVVLRVSTLKRPSEKRLAATTLGQGELSIQASVGQSTKGKLLVAHDSRE